jgi:hypothetical protein
MFSRSRVPPQRAVIGDLKSLAKPRPQLFTDEPQKELSDRVVGWSFMFCRLDKVLHPPTEDVSEIGSDGIAEPQSVLPLVRQLPPNDT